MLAGLKAAYDLMVSDHLHGNDSDLSWARAGFIQTRIIPNNDTIRGVKFDDMEYVRERQGEPGENKVLRAF